MRILVVCKRMPPARALAYKMQREAARHGVAASVEVMEVSGLPALNARLADVQIPSELQAPKEEQTKAAEYDAVLLSPRVYEEEIGENTARLQLCASVPVWAIPSSDFERMNAKKIVNDLLRMLGE